MIEGFLVFFPEIGKLLTIEGEGVQLAESSRSDVAGRGQRNSNGDSMMCENELATKVLDCCFKIHRNLGPGLFESVYEELLCFELKCSRLEFKRQLLVPLVYEGVKMDMGFRADVIVENKVILELKSVECVNPVHKNQLLTYLKLTGLKLGLLINFNVALMKDGITRMANDL